MWASWIWPGLSHCAGALAIQAALAWLLATNGIPGYQWWGALAGGGFFVVREVWQWRQKEPPVWWQNRAPWDMGTAVIPVVITAAYFSWLAN